MSRCVCIFRVCFIDNVRYCRVSMFVYPILNQSTQVKQALHPSLGVGIFHVTPRFNPTLVGWNLGLTWKFPTRTSLSRCTYNRFTTPQERSASIVIPKYYPVTILEIIQNMQGVAEAFSSSGRTSSSFSFLTLFLC